MPIVRKNSHEAAWDRLAAEHIFPATDAVLVAEEHARRAYASYQWALQEAFRGRDRGEADLARLLWCQAETRLVSLRAHERKVMARQRARLQPKPKARPTRG